MPFTQPEIGIFNWPRGCGLSIYLVWLSYRSREIYPQFFFSVSFNINSADAVDQRAKRPISPTDLLIFSCSRPHTVFPDDAISTLLHLVNLMVTFVHV